MGTQQIDVTVTSPAEAEAVWALLADVTTWSRWGPYDETALEQAGAPDPHGAGSIRRLNLGKYATRERVVVFEPAERLEYEVVSGIPVRDYRGVVTLERVPDGGTAIRWRSSFKAAYPGTGALMRRRLERFIRDLAGQLAVAARAASADAGGS